jgi:hypothetical protein
VAQFVGLLLNFKEPNLLRCWQDTAQFKFASFDCGAFEGFNVAYLSIGHKPGIFRAHRQAAKGYRPKSIALSSHWILVLRRTLRAYSYYHEAFSLPHGKKQGGKNLGGVISKQWTLSRKLYSALPVEKQWPVKK